MLLKKGERKNKVNVMESLKYKHTHTHISTHLHTHNGAILLQSFLRATPEINVNGIFFVQKLKLLTFYTSAESFSQEYVNVSFRLHCYKKISFTLKER